jgi:hypothetical protein
VVQTKPERGLLAHGHGGGSHSLAATATTAATRRASPAGAGLPDGVASSAVPATTDTAAQYVSHPPQHMLSAIPARAQQGLGRLHRSSTQYRQ